MSEQIRGQETSAYLSVDGEMLQGSFTKILDWKISTRSEITDGDYVGEDSSEPDIRVDGYEFSFSMDTKDAKAIDLWLTIAERERQHLPHPAMNLVIIERFRNASTPTLTIVCERAVIKMDDHGAGGRKENVKTSFSGKCRRASKL